MWIQNLKVQYLQIANKMSEKTNEMYDSSRYVRSNTFPPLQPHKLFKSVKSFLSPNSCCVSMERISPSRNRYPPVWTAKLPFSHQLNCPAFFNDDRKAFWKYAKNRISLQTEANSILFICKFEFLKDVLFILHLLVSCDRVDTTNHLKYASDLHASLTGSQWWHKIPRDKQRDRNRRREQPIVRERVKKWREV